jgi:cytochrome subunit of sulfide dehydrogenase
VNELPSPTYPCGLGPPSSAMRERVLSAARRVRVLPPVGALTALIIGSATAAEPPAGATSCSGCHPARATADSPVPPIRGRDSAEIVAAMQAFRSGERSSTVMGRIAKGFSEDETRAIAAWLAAQR